MLHLARRRSNNALREAQLHGKTRGNIRLDVDEKMSTVHHRTDTYVEKPSFLYVCQRIVSPRTFPSRITGDTKIKSLLLQARKKLH